MNKRVTPSLNLRLASLLTCYLEHVDSSGELFKTILKSGQISARRVEFQLLYYCDIIFVSLRHQVGILLLACRQIVSLGFKSTHLSLSNDVKHFNTLT